LAFIGARDDIESEMNRHRAIQDTQRERVKRQRRATGARSKPFRQKVFVGQRDDLQTPRSPADGAQDAVSRIGLDGEQSGVRLLDTEFGEVA